MSAIYLLSRATAFVALSPLLLWGAPRLIAPQQVTVGRHLQTFASVRLSEPAPPGGLEVTITSEDPARLLLSTAMDERARPSITLRVNPQYVETPDFFLHAVGELGAAGYKATAGGYEQAVGRAQVAPSAFVLVGPYKAAAFRTTTGTTARFSVFPAVVDDNGEPVARQAFAEGKPVELTFTSSKPEVGKTEPSRVVFRAGVTGAEAEFRPAAPGETVVSINAPLPFLVARDSGAVKAVVDQPGIGLSGDLTVGKDLQAQGLLLLGEPAPKGGLDVRVRSTDGSKLVLSASHDQLGSESITLHVAEGGMRAVYYIQALGSQGTVECIATAKGYRERSVPVYLAPSGVMVVYWLYGPPDEAEVVRSTGVRDPRPFTASLGDKKPAYVTLWPVYLDPKTRRGADRTAQRLRPGVSAEVELRNSNPAVAEVPAKIVLRDAAEFVMAEFKPRAVGQTVISVSVPAGFTEPTNGASVTATVRE